MNLSRIGRIAWCAWFKTPLIRPDMNLHLGPFVVMPDHFHAIIAINSKDAMPCISCKGAMSRAPHTPKNCFGPQSQNLPSIIRGFKISVTKYARIIHPEFAWQSLYHDHIIRNESEYNRVAQYIIDNPANW